MYSYTTHITLLAKLRDEESPTAWDDFCERYGALIRSFARGQGLQPADCDDVLQEVLLALTRAMPGFEYDPSKGKFRSFLKTITLRAVFRKSRQKQRPGEPGSDDEAALEAAADPAVDERWEEEWRQYHLQQAMKTVEVEFGEGDRAAFRLYAIERRGASETAEALGLSMDQVYQAKSRILKRIAELVAVQTADEG